MSGDVKTDMFSDIDYEKMTGLISKGKYEVAQITIEQGINNAKIIFFVGPEETVEFGFHEFQKILDKLLESLRDYD